LDRECPWKVAEEQAKPATAARKKPEERAVSLKHTLDVMLGLDPSIHL